MKVIIVVILTLIAQGSGIRDQVLEVSGVRYQVLEASGFGYQVSGVRYNVAGIDMDQTILSPFASGYLSSLQPFSLSLEPFAHDFHLSNVEIEYNAKAQSLQMIMHLFIDDLEDGIAQSGVDKKLYLCTEREVEGADQYIRDYISSKFSVSVDGQPMEYVFLGKETSEDIVAMDCYLEIENLNSVSEIEISNDLLMEVFDDQVNIIKLKSTLTGKKGFMMLKKGSHTDTVQL
ncbi:MAG: hypothetical protein KJP00_11415 [Bacteroidia bacterium]|nr:hypothetical protein [Bacteroidia bacterium]